MASVAFDNQDQGRFSVGRVIGRATGTVARNPLVTIGLALLLGSAPALLLTMAMAGSGSLGPDINPNAVAGLAALGMLGGLTTMALTLVVQGALTRAAVADSEGRRATFGECLRAALKVVLPMLGVLILWSLSVGLGMLLLLVPGIILMLMWSVAVPALVEERTGVFGAFARSRMLTSGHRWKILGLLLLLLGAYMLVAIVFSLIGLSNLGNVTNPESAVRGLGPAMLFARLIPSTLFNLAWGILQPSLFIELRNLKEGGSVANLQEIFA
jgi:hypothetical protein